MNNWRVTIRHGAAVAAMLASFGVAACERKPQSAVERPIENAHGSPFKDGSVGDAVSRYTLRMPAVRVWYGIARDLGAAAEAQQVRLSLDFPLDSPLKEQAERVDSVPLLRRVLDEHHIRADSFVVLTSAVGAMRASLMLADSLGSSGRPANIGESVLVFARQHRREIDSLEASLRR